MRDFSLSCPQYVGPVPYTSFTRSKFITTINISSPYQLFESEDNSTMPCISNTTNTTFHGPRLQHPLHDKNVCAEVSGDVAKELQLALLCVVVAFPIAYLISAMTAAIPHKWFWASKPWYFWNTRLDGGHTFRTLHHLLLCDSSHRRSLGPDFYLHNLYLSGDDRSYTFGV